jgi:hypothetical protein
MAELAYLHEPLAIKEPILKLHQLIAFFMAHDSSRA